MGLSGVGVPSIWFFCTLKLQSNLPKIFNRAHLLIFIFGQYIVVEPFLKEKINKVSLAKDLLQIGFCKNWLKTISTPKLHPNFPNVINLLDMYQIGY